MYTIHEKQMCTYIYLMQLYAYVLHCNINVSMEDWEQCIYMYLSNSDVLFMFDMGGGGGSVGRGSLGLCSRLV